VNRSQPLRRTPLARTSGLARVAGLRRRPQRPPSRPAHLDVPADTRRMVERRSGGRCEIGLTGVCDFVAIDVHHRRKRNIGLHPHAIWNLVHACRSCHSAAHGAPTQAREAGWIVSQYAEPSRIPVLIRGTLRLLAADGSYLDREGL
jgi:5-methylcytosine-specific restriction endonuclease McrA